jgi:hypothetical protein
LLIAVVASAIALFFGYYGAVLIYLAAKFAAGAPIGQGMDIIFGVASYITVVTAAVFVPLIAVVAAAIAWLCWKAARLGSST